MVQLKFNFNLTKVISAIPGCKGMFWYKFKIYTPNVCQQYTFSCKKTGKLDIF